MCWNAKQCKLPAYKLFFLSIQGSLSHVFSNYAQNLGNRSMIMQLLAVQWFACYWLWQDGLEHTQKMLYASTLLWAIEKQVATSCRCMPTHLSHLSIFPHVVVETRKRSPPCLIVACKSIHARACNNQTWWSASCYITKEIGRKERRKQ